MWAARTKREEQGRTRKTAGRTRETTERTSFIAELLWLFINININILFLRFSIYYFGQKKNKLTL